MDKNKFQLEVDELLTRGVDSLFDRARLEEKLLNGKKLRIKFGIDPTSPYIHIGRTVPILKLKKFQELGHQIVLIIGDFTGLIGDTSDKNAERQMLSKETVEKNLKTYAQQFGKLVDLSKVEIHHNSEWLGKLTYWEICDQADKFSVNDFISRTNIRTRLESDGRVSLREVLYPMMQGYDSLMVKADVEVGGSDQWFNLLAGRTMQKSYGHESQDVLTTRLMIGLDGRKMSSSYGNTVNILDSPEEMYGKIMSMKDDYIIDYFVHCTEVPMDRIENYKTALDDGVNPRDIKMELAFELAKMYHGETGAKKGRDYFDNTIRNKETPKKIQEVKIKKGNLAEILIFIGFSQSKSESHRLIREGGVKVNEKIIDNPDLQPESGAIIQKGKRQFARIIF